MSKQSWLARWFGRRPAGRAERSSYKPKLEMLEDRLAPATFVVTNFTDTLRTAGTLRAAIRDANENPGADNIVFAASLVFPPQVRTITLNTPLPAITDAVTINGSLPGAGGPTPGIELNGANLSDVSAVGLKLNADGCTIKGLIINRFFANGLLVSSNNNIIQGCLVGTNKEGTAGGGGQTSAIRVEGDNNLIGGASPEARNVVSGNSFGISVVNDSGRLATGNLIQGNFVGLNAAGNAAVRNFTGIEISLNAQNNVVADNLISGNLNRGILLDAQSGFNAIRHNRIGVAADGVTPLGNQRIGILIRAGAHDNQIGGPGGADGNLIAFNGQCGVLIGNDTIGTTNPAGSGNQLQNNLIFGSPALIDLGPGDGPTPNDSLDADTGPNNFQNFPTLLSAARNATATSVAGTLSSQPGRSYRIEVTNFDQVSNQNQFILGSFIVTTDANGSVTFNQFFGVSLVSSQVIAIATDLTTGDTSEFGNAVPVDTAPMIRNDVLTPDINEGEKATLSGQLVDPDKGDKLSLVVNWGDGSPVQTYHPKLDPFAFKHLFEDDGAYNVQFTWIDDHGASNTRTRQVVVHNVPPLLQNVALHPDDANVHQQVVLTGKIVEPGADHLALSVDWGDGTVEAVSGSDLRNFKFKHRYKTAGQFTVLVTVDDGDGGSDAKTLFVGVA